MVLVTAVGSACSHDCSSVGYVSGVEVQLPAGAWSLSEFCVDDHCLSDAALSANSRFVDLVDEPAEYSWRIRLVQPDGTPTPRGQSVIDATPMARFGEPDELIGTAVWLASDASRFVTGISVPVDGGFSAYAGV